MKRLILILFIFSLLPFKILPAQSYNTSLGVRLSNGDDFRMGGISIQQRIFNKFTVEGIAQTDFNHNSSFHALIERHQNIITKSLNFYFGAGVYCGIEENNVSSKVGNETITTTTYNNKTFGADLIAGLELSLLRFNISLDYKPNFNIIGRENWYQGQIALSLRAIIFKGPLTDKSKKKKTESIFKKEPAKKEKTTANKPTIEEFIKDLFKKENK